MQSLLVQSIQLHFCLRLLRWVDNAVLAPLRLLLIIFVCQSSNSYCGIYSFEIAWNSRSSHTKHCHTEFELPLANRDEFIGATQEVCFNFFLLSSAAFKTSIYTL